MDLVVFNNYVNSVMTEKMAQDVEKFNENSKDVIRLIADPQKGDFSYTSSFSNIKNLTRRRNARSAAPINTEHLAQITDVSVKVDAGTPNISWTKQEYLRTLQNPELASIVIGEQLAKAAIGDMLNTAISSVVAALQNNSNALYVGASDPTGLVNAASLFGDRSNSIKAWVVHSGFMTGLFNYALQNNAKLFTYETVNVIVDPFGRLFIVTDAPRLIKRNASGDLEGYFAAGLVENAVTISKNNDFNSVVVPGVGRENIEYNYQAEWSYNLKMKGYSWDTENGGTSPNDTALGTGINWKKTASSIKDTAGVLLATV